LHGHADKVFGKYRAGGVGVAIKIKGLRGIEWAIFDAEGLTKPRIT
jgi:hypothetical protein